MLIKTIIGILFTTSNLISFCTGLTSVLSLLDGFAPLVNILHGGIREVCYARLGCFSNSGPFLRSKYRPISVVPQPPEVIGTQFRLFTRANPYQYQIINAYPQTIKKSYFNPNRETKIIVHGFQEGISFGEYQKDMIIELKDALLKSNDYNVIITRWTRGATGVYFKAVANTRVVGAEIALFINTITQYTNTKAEKFHVIGHSLGAQIAGYVGKRVPRLGRITALDAAKPYFDGMHISVRLNRNDALSIDAIHTDAPSKVNPFGMGTRLELGNIDFFPNNGNNQPGCRSEIEDARSKGAIAAVTSIFTCDHQRSLRLAIDSLLHTDYSCLPVAYRCQDWDHFYLGHCTTCGKSAEDCAILDLSYNNGYKPIDRIKGSKFFLITNERHPFCVFQYLIQIKTSLIGVAMNVQFHLTFNDANNISTYYQTKVITVVPDKVTSFVVGSERNFDTMKIIDIKWIQKTNNRDNDYTVDNKIIGVESILMTPLNHLSDNEKNKLSKKFCSPFKQIIKMSNSLSFTFDTHHCH